MRRFAAFVAVMSMLVFAACGGDDPSIGDGSARVGCGEGAVVVDRPLEVVTTVAPITDIVASIAAGADVSVTGVVPEGADSHTYEPTPGVAATLEGADVIILNGLQLEEPTLRLASANLADGAEICELGTSILDPAEYRFDESFPEAAGAPNPHLWTNPPMVIEYAGLIRDVLSARRPADADRFEANHELFVAAVDALDAAVRSATATIPVDDRLLLTYHDAYAYFAEEYGWIHLGALQPSSFDEPTPREIAALIEQIRELNVPTIFGSEVFPSPVLRQLADETGADYVDDLRDDDLPGDPGDAEHSWFELMRFNVSTIVEALGGDPSALLELDVVLPDGEATFA